MADQIGASANDLIDQLWREPGRFDFFQAMRLLECAYPERKRLGTSVRLANDPVRLAQDPHMEFAPNTLSSVTHSDQHPPRLAVYSFGLFGPNGPLPLHLTEYARERIYHHHDPTFSRFADIFHHRMLCLFYRAWANGQPAVSQDRPEESDFTFFVSALAGYGLAALQGHDAMPDYGKCYFAGHLALQTRPPEGLSHILNEIFVVTTRVLEFIGEWMPIAVSDQSRLGVSLRLAALWESTVLGASVWGCQHKFRLVMGPMSLGDYRDLLPGSPGLRLLNDVVRNYVGDELVFDVNLILLGNEVPACCLDGTAQLGWTTWFCGRDSATDADELILNPRLSAAKGPAAIPSHIN